MNFEYKSGHPSKIDLKIYTKDNEGALFVRGFKTFSVYMTDATGEVYKCDDAVSFGIAVSGETEQEGFIEALEALSNSFTKLEG